MSFTVKEEGVSSMFEEYDPLYQEQELNASNISQRQHNDNAKSNGNQGPDVAPSPIRMKRQQAVRACTHCKRLHAKCSNERPCKRCENNGLASSCVDSPRKPRMGKALKAMSINGLPDKGKQISIFSDPANLVLTHLEGRISNYSDVKSSFALPTLPDLRTIESPKLGTKQVASNAIFKTEKLGPISQSTSHNGTFATEAISPMIFIPTDNGNDSSEPDEKEPTSHFADTKPFRFTEKNEKQDIADALKSPFSLTVG